MFDDGEWNSDEDFLNDADYNKAFEYYSQLGNDDELPAKRRKTEETHNRSLFSFGDISDNDFSLTESVNKDASSSGVDWTARKNLICDILRKNSSTQKEVERTSTQSEELNKTQQESNRTEPNTGKNLVLNILRNKDDPSLSVDKNETEKIDTFGTNHQKTSQASSVKKPESRSIYAPKVSHNLNNTLKENNVNKVNRIAEKTANISSINQSQRKGPNEQDNTRKQLLLDLLKKPATEKGNQTTNNLQSKSFVHKCERQINEKTALIRRFPGPAGLLPDIAEKSFSLAPYYRSLNENDNSELKELKESKDSDFSDFCSQNTKHLFTEGAWKIMSDDLPMDFLKGHEICTIKQKANANANVKKVPFLAAVLERIDHSYENPPVILKDFTDNIQGIMHRDIPLKYPGLFEPNVVILLHNTGLLKMSMSSKYHILISPSNLLAVYSATEKILQTPAYKSVFDRESTGDPPLQNTENSIDKFALSSNVLQDSFLDTVLNESNKSPKKSSQENKTSNVKNSNAFTDSDQNFNSGIDDDLFVDLQDITSSQSEKKFEAEKIKDSSTSIMERNNLNNLIKQNRSPDRNKQNDIQNVKDFDKNNQDKLSTTLSTEKNQKNNNDKPNNLLSTLKQFSFDKNNVKKKPLLKTRVDVMHLNESSNNSESNQRLKMLEDDLDDSLLVGVEDILQSGNSSELKENIETTINTKQHENRSSLKKKLCQFKNNDVMTQMESNCSLLKKSTCDVDYSKDDKKKSNKNLSDTNFVDDLLCDSEDDTDEILSQLNIDDICGN